MDTHNAKIIYTITDEAPALATGSFLPIIKSFVKKAGIQIQTKDISLASRILVNFSEYFPQTQKIIDDLKDLGSLTKTPQANIIKLPNISASVPQLKTAIKELQDKGYNIPDYPENPQNEKETLIKNTYAKVLGSAVNPILREGNSDRRVAAAVKCYAKDNPHTMGSWSRDSKSHVASMSEGDFYSSEKSVVLPKDDVLQITLTTKNEPIKVLKESIPVLEGEIVDAAVLSTDKLKTFISEQLVDAQENHILFSVHMKATMMKVADPIIFGVIVRVFYKEIFEKYADTFGKLGINPNNGIGEVYTKMQTLPQQQQEQIKADIQALYKKRPNLAMVDSQKGITNLHVPSDVIIDASMPAMIRNSGKMWNAQGTLQDTKAIIPDRSYGGVYQTVIDFCKANGAFDPATMGTVPNVGLMAQKAEEYGSHDKTFLIDKQGIVEITNQAGEVLLSQKVAQGDIFRASQVKDASVQDWVKLAVNRARATQIPAVFWLDENRAHDKALIKKINQYLPQNKSEGLDIRILSPVEATQYTLQRLKNGKDTLSITGNVLRDYLTDLFPIIELGTSAKMLSIVPLMHGGGLFETGAGGSAPKHVEQLLNENHLRWDSLGEFLALAVSLEDIAHKTNNHKAKILAQALNEANAKFLKNNKSPLREVGTLDTRGSHYYLAMYWAESISKQTSDLALATAFQSLYNTLKYAETQIIKELTQCQGKPVNIGGYYLPDPKKMTQVMRPSETLNALINSF